MDDFTLKSLDDFDKDFIAQTKAPKAAAPAHKKESLIPKMEKPVDEEPIEIDFFGLTGDFAPEENIQQETPATPEPVYQDTPATAASPAVSADDTVPGFAPVDESVSGFNPVINAPVSAPVNTPPAPLYTSEKMSDNGIDQFMYNPSEDGVEDDYYEADYEERKSSKGATAGKVISIIMLVATVVVFVLGCFVSVFLDNGSEIGGMTFSTYAQEPQSGIITKGSLVIAKKVAPDEYTAQDTVIVPSSTGEGCDIMGVISTAPESEESCLLTMTNSSNPNGMTGTYRSADTLGKALYFLPGVGGLLNFATHNAILVCILFILLAALWCLIFILIEKSQSGKNSDDGDEDEDDDDDSDSSEEKTDESEEDDSDEPVYKF
jgi:flagellar basal body-associated protein FliL